VIPRALLTALGTSACLGAVVLSAVAAGLRAVDAALATYRVEIREVPADWVTEFYGETP
jgi:purine nucleoside permease